MRPREIMNKQKKQAAVFESLVVPHMSMLYKAAWRLTGRPDDAEDLVQQVMVKLYPRTVEMQAIEQLGPWLKKVVYREFVDAWRKKVRRPEHYLAHTPEDFGEVQAEADNPAVLVERASDQQRVRAALDQLKEKDQTLIVMHLVDGYTLPELQEFFNEPLETIKTRLRRARARLKKNLME